MLQDEIVTGVFTPLFWHANIRENPRYYYDLCRPTPKISHIPLWRSVDGATCK